MRAPSDHAAFLPCPPQEVIKDPSLLTKPVDFVFKALDRDHNGYIDATEATNAANMCAQAVAALHRVP